MDTQKFNQSGFALVEIMAAMTVAAIMSLSLVYSYMTALRTGKYVEVNQAATSLAVSKIEQLSAIDIPNLNSADGGTETSVFWPGFGFDFTRVTTVTVNPNQSRTVAVVVSSNHEVFNTSVELQSDFASWE